MGLSGILQLHSPQQDREIAVGHGSAGPIMKDEIFKGPSMPDPFKQTKYICDAILSVLIGGAAFKSIDAEKQS